MTIRKSTAATKSIISENRGLFLRQLIPIALALLGIALFYEHVLALDFSLIGTTLEQVTSAQWGMAITATGISYWAIGRYDGLIHGMLGTGISPQTARKSGATSIAIAQFAGFGVLTGTLVRWRLLPDFSLLQSLKVSACVSASFLAGWACITALGLLISGVDLGNHAFWPLIVLVALGTLIVLSVWQPKLKFSLPSLRMIGTVLFLVATDLVFAGVSLYALLPPEIIVTPAIFFAVYLLAFGAGLLSGTPGGIGPFELTMIALLPLSPAEPLLASILAYRLIYFALPASIATIALINGQLRERTAPQATLDKPNRQAYLSPKLEQSLWKSDWAEANLLRQGDFGCMSIDGHPTAIVAPLGQTLVMLGAPLNNPNFSPFLNQFKQLAREKRLGAFLYKCPPQLALAARKAGMQVLPVVREAWINPMAFSIATPARRQLRRFIRKAENANLDITEVSRELPFAELSAVSDNWSQHHNGERGFSMGVFDADYISCQRVFVARIKGDIVAFLTLHENQKEWVVDLMRSTSDAPCGTMHSLICAAIKCAGENRIARLSLASVPHLVKADSRMLQKLRQHVYASGNADGLLRFKNSFAPQWRTLYAVAPGNLTLFFGLFEVLRAIHQSSHSPKKLS